MNPVEVGFKPEQNISVGLIIFKLVGIFGVEWLFMLNWKQRGSMHFNIIPPCTIASSKWSVPFMF